VQLVRKFLLGLLKDDSQCSWVGNVPIVSLDRPIFISLNPHVRVSGSRRQTIAHNPPHALCVRIDKTPNPPVPLELGSDLYRLFPPYFSRDGPVERVNEVSLVQRFNVESVSPNQVLFGGDATEEWSRDDIMVKKQGEMHEEHGQLETLTIMRYPPMSFLKLLRGRRHPELCLLDFSTC